MNTRPQLDRQSRFLLSTVLVGFLVLSTFPVDQWVSDLATAATLVSFVNILRGSGTEVAEDSASGSSESGADITTSSASQSTAEDGDDRAAGSETDTEATRERQPSPDEPSVDHESGVTVSSGGAETTPRVERDATAGSQMGPFSLWTRGRGETAPLPHRYCSVSPRSGRDRDGSPDGPRLCFGRVRWMLEYTPLVVLALSAVLFVTSELDPSVAGVTSLVALPDVLWLGTVGALAALAIGVTLRPRYAAPVVVYGTFGLLAAATVYTSVLVSLVEAPTTSVIATSPLTSAGYLLALFVGGHLVYDGILRTETVLQRLPEKLVVTDPERYASLIEELRSDLEVRYAVAGREIPVAYVFAAAVLLSTVSVREFETVFELVTGVAFVAVEFVALVVAFQFVVLCWFLWRLLRTYVAESTRGDGTPLLAYVAFHPDGRGGFAEFGHIAVRVTTVLVVVGFYALYRVTVLGPTARPVGTGVTFGWLLVFPGPLALYLVGFVGWVSFSFLYLHRVMRVGRATHLGRLFEDPDATVHDRRVVHADAPLWPASPTLVLGLLCCGLFPPAITLFTALWL